MTEAFPDLLSITNKQLINKGVQSSKTTIIKAKITDLNELITNQCEIALDPSKDKELMKVLLNNITTLNGVGTINGSRILHTNSTALDNNNTNTNSNNPTNVKISKRKTSVEIMPVMAAMPKRHSTDSIIGIKSSPIITTKKSFNTTTNSIGRRRSRSGSKDILTGSSFTSDNGKSVDNNNSNDNRYSYNNDNKNNKNNSKNNKNNNKNDKEVENSIDNDEQISSFELILLELENRESHSDGLPALKPDDHDVILWFGDLNYRIDNNIDIKTVYEYIHANQSMILTHYDQLNQEREKGTVFHEFHEGLLIFDPTYQYIVGTDQYDDRPDKKMRCPAWCDRVLWRIGKGYGNLNQSPDLENSELQETSDNYASNTDSNRNYNNNSNLNQNSNSNYNKKLSVTTNTRTPFAGNNEMSDDEDDRDNEEFEGEEWEREAFARRLSNNSLQAHCTVFGAPKTNDRSSPTRNLLPITSPIRSTESDDVSISSPTDFYTDSGLSLGRFSLDNNESNSRRETLPTSHFSSSPRPDSYRFSLASFSSYNIPCQENIELMEYGRCPGDNKISDHKPVRAVLNMKVKR